MYEAGYYLRNSVGITTVECRYQIRDLVLASAEPSLANSLLVLQSIIQSQTFGSYSFHIPQTGSGQTRQSLYCGFSAFHAEAIKRCAEVS